MVRLRLLLVALGRGRRRRRRQSRRQAAGGLEGRGPDLADAEKVLGHVDVVATKSLLLL